MEIYLLPDKYGGSNVVHHNLMWVERKTRASLEFYWNPNPKDISSTVSLIILHISAKKVKPDLNN